MRAFLIASGAAVLLAGCTAMDDSGTPAATSAGMSAATYLEMARSSDMFEVESGRLALEVARYDAVRSFAQKMVDDHTRMLAEMERAGGAAMPTMQMMAAQAAAMQRLRSVSPDEFDLLYKREQVAAHREALNLHRSYARTGGDRALREKAAWAVPVIERHLAEAEALPDDPLRNAIMQTGPAEGGGGTTPAEPKRRRGQQG